MSALDRDRSASWTAAGSTSDSHRVQRRTRRTRGLDDPTACRGGGDGVCREHLPGDGAARCLKKRTQAVEEEGVVHPGGERGVRGSWRTCWTCTMQTTGPDHLVVCFDETSRQLVADKRPVIGAKPGRVERYDYEYKRNGTRNLFMFCEPKAGWRHVEVTQHCCGLRHQMRWLVDEAYPRYGWCWTTSTPRARLVVRCLQASRHGAASAWRLHYTPVHGSWLNMAEIELSVFSNQCLNRRISDEVGTETRGLGAGT